MKYIFPIFSNFLVINHLITLMIFLSLKKHSSLSLDQTFNTIIIVIILICFQKHSRIENILNFESENPNSQVPDMLFSNNITSTSHLI